VPFFTPVEIIVAPREFRTSGMRALAALGAKADLTAGRARKATSKSEAKNNFSQRSDCSCFSEIGGFLADGCSKSRTQPV
jgi:hypothetical protein